MKPCQSREAVFGDRGAEDRTHGRVEDWTDGIRRERCRQRGMPVREARPESASGTAAHAACAAGPSAAGPKNTSRMKRSE